MQIAEGSSRETTCSVRPVDNFGKIVWTMRTRRRLHSHLCAHRPLPGIRAIAAILKGTTTGTDGTATRHRVRAPGAGSKSPNLKGHDREKAKEKAAKARAKGTSRNRPPYREWGKREWHLCRHHQCHRHLDPRNHGCSLQRPIMPLEDRPKRHL